MHPNPAFRAEDRARNVAFARERAFGVLAVNAPDGPLLSHIPFALNEAGNAADLHLVRSNPIARLGAVQAVIAVSGPDGYVSPDWYGVADQVPTWNYVAVHLRGRLEPLDHGEMRAMLDRQSADYETRLAPKTPWTTDKMTPQVLDRMMRQILPFRMTVERIDGTWKLGQNKPVEARRAAAAQISSGLGHELDRLRRLMDEAD
ncbi:FMN-binding negative transcriptional regulator [Alphaproteobacteria bacterium GH1-50]|uniref:FMN-binding negative transcriptional regulator n=1 Tax=Kangsaoukella pontilimi TaxID=2691042 RepID=A0A7C9IGQ0_9RHOB|nr:FMN-binding negative transcriptional regulator [Kangsaoukella pontilimi]MXQ08127.1 FMN-binding negative transcriptional regulator [Kangsaoukella pontilimi]